MPAKTSSSSSISSPFSPQQNPNYIERSSCAVGGFFGDFENNKLVFEFLAKLPHRGGQMFVKEKDETIKVGDGAGISFDIDHKYYNKFLANNGYGINKDDQELLGIGNIFLPVDKDARKKAQAAILRICKENGVSLLEKNNKDGTKTSWRRIPFKSQDSKDAKNLKLQKFSQCFLKPDSEELKKDPKKFEAALQKIDQEIEAYALELDNKCRLDPEYQSGKKKLPKLAVASISSERVVYKGMILPHEVEYFTDLQECELKNVAYHIRQSTNVSPSPGNSQPFKRIGHNGELNSVDGNAYKNHNPEGQGFSDSRIFDQQLSSLIAEGKNVIEAITILMPPGNTGDKKIDAMLEDIRAQGLEYNGPAHMVFSSGGISGARMDNSALRPSNYLIAKKKNSVADATEFLFIGSEDMFSAEKLQEMELEVVKRGKLKAGEMIVLQDGKVKKNKQILEELAEKHEKQFTFTPIEGKEIEIPAKALALGHRDSSDVKYHMNSIIFAGTTNKIAMGDDTSPIKDNTEKLAELTQEKFSQVSSPPIDSKKERKSFSTKTFLGDQTKTKNNTLGVKPNLYTTNSPILKLGELEAIKATPANKVFNIDLSFDLENIPKDARNNKEKITKLLKEQVRKICEQVEKEILAGKSIIILDGSQISESKIGLPDMLVTAAVYSYLHSKNQNLEKKASIIVNSAEAQSAHHVSSLMALGAKAVNPIGFYDLAAEFANRETEISEKQKKYQEYCKNTQHALEDAHLVTMAKYGITSTETYYASRLLETMNLNLHKSKEEENNPAYLGNAFARVKYCHGFMGKKTTDDILSDSIISHQKRYGEKIITPGTFAYSPNSDIDHSYNPTTVGAIRNLTTEYGARRALVKDYENKANILKQKLLDSEKLKEEDWAKYQEELQKNKTNNENEIKQENKNLNKLRIANDKLFNSLFFIDGIAKQLAKILKGSKEQEILEQLRKENDVEKTPDSRSSRSASADIEGGESLLINKADRALIRQFLSVVNKEGLENATDNFTKICREYREGRLDFNDFKKALFKKAGYVASELEKIEEWAKLIQDNKFAEAGEIFNKLNEKNKERIAKTKRTYEDNKIEINTLKEKLTNIGLNQTINNILLESANNTQSTAKYKNNLSTKIKELEERIKKNNLLPEIKDGRFDRTQMDEHQVDSAFQKAMNTIVENKKDFPVTIADHLDINFPESKNAANDNSETQTISDIVANHLATGGMSHGALTKSAHNDVAKAATLVGGIACTGEGGKPKDQKAKMVQVASGRFGLDPEYFVDAEIIEIKIVQGAKPGEGGMLPGSKVSVEISAVRGSIPGIDLISPPPHHDIYSIEDLQELIHDLKELKPGVKVGVKLCASEGIDQIAIGVAKSGADIINIASNSGGTGAASVDAIKTTGMPGEIGLVMVNQALSNAGIRDLVQLSVSGFPNTPEGVIMMAILGGDILEYGTTALIMLGCDMHRKCNVPGACAPGITNNEEGYQGHAEDLALYDLNLAASVQKLLKKLGVNSLKELRGRVDLLSADRLKNKVSEEFIASLLAAKQYPQLSKEDLEEYRTNANQGSNLKEYKILEEQNLADKILGKDKAIFELGEIDVTNRTFGTSLVLPNYKELQKKAADHITIKTNGTAGQSFGAFNCHGICLSHEGPVQDGSGKSMSGGILVVKKPKSEAHLENSIYVGNAALFGAMSGKAFIPSAGNRCAVLMKGATLVVNGNVGDYACEYMTSGSALFLGKIGANFGEGMSGGIAVIYDNGKISIESLSEDVRLPKTPEEAENYYAAIKELLTEDLERTDDQKIKSLLDNFENEKNKYKIIIPKTLDKIASLEKLNDLKRSFALRNSPLSIFEEAWLKAKEKEIKILEQQAKNQNKLDQQAIYIGAQLAADVTKHIDRMRQYAPLAADIVGGLGIMDESLSDDINELMDELFYRSTKCRGCDSGTCSGEKTKKEKQAVSGCAANKEPLTINSILKGDGEFKRKTELEKAKEAFLKQIEQSPFAGFTGAACPAPCQSACAQTVKNQGNAEAVAIRRIELLLHKIAVIKGWYEEHKIFKQPEIQQNKKVMIIGSGPAALEAAYHLAKAGISVEIFEKSNKLGGLLRYGIPDHKLQKDTIDFYLPQLEAMGIKFNTRSEVDINKLNINYQGYDLYLDARGLVPIAFDEKFQGTNIDQGGNHSMAIDFLSYCNEYFANEKEGIEIEHPFIKFNLKKEVVLIGAGDTAEDVKSTIERLNTQLSDNNPLKVQLTIISRQPELTEQAKIGTNYPNPREKNDSKLAQDKDFTSHHNTSPNKFITENNRITGLECDETYSVEYRFARPLRTTSKIGEKTISCDSVITAIGFKAPPLAEGTVRNFNNIGGQGKIVPIGDLAAKSGLMNGNLLIVSAQASAKKVAQDFIDQVISPGTLLNSTKQRPHITIALTA